MMLSPRLSFALSSVICLMLVVPAVEAMVLPLRSAVLLLLAETLVMYFAAVRKWELVNHTCFWRSALLVVEPHSMSTVPLAIRGMRDDEVTGVYLTSSLASFSSVFTASTTL